MFEFPTMKYAGIHLIIELWGVEPELLTDEAQIRDTLIDAARDCGATVLGDNFHGFPGGGITGIVILAESHISIHSFPECGYAALDVFTCGRCDPKDTLPRIVDYFKPGNIDINTLIRGKHK